MLKSMVLVGVCLISVASAVDWLTGLKRSVQEQMRQAGSGVCDMANPCVNGFCEEENGNAICYCDYPYTGEFCDQVCPFDQCWDDYWQDMAKFWNEDEDEDDSCIKRRHSNGSPDHLRKALNSKKRAAALRKRGPSGEHSYDKHSYDKHCRDGIRELLKCLDSNLADQSYCGSCDNGTVSWIADVVTRRGKIADEYCSDDWECKDQETAQCVEFVNQMFEFHHGANATEKAEMDKDAIHGHLDEVETCLTKIVNEELTLAGCLHNSWIKNELLLFMVEIVRAEVNGCNLTQVGIDCGLNTMLEDMDMVCSLNIPEREALLDTTLECGRTQAAAIGPVCDGYLDKLTPAKPHLIKESVKECGRLSKIDDIVGVCSVKKRTSKLENLLETLSKEGEDAVLKLLLRKLADKL